jgi:hypothetical protein
MDLTVFVFLALFAFVALGMWLATRSARRQREQAQGQLAADAAARGWTFESTTEGLFDLQRWSGQTDGHRWTAEYRRGRHRKRSSHTRTHRLRWWTEGFGGPSTPILLIGVPRGKERLTAQLPLGGGMLATMAQKAAGFALDKALDVHFGEQIGRQIDARELRLVEGVEVPGFIVMAADGAQARFWLDQAGHRQTLLAQVADAASAFSNEQDRPWVLLLGRHLTLAQPVPVRSTADLERLVRAGVALAEAFR